ncbi:hypothetical protein GALMADRAFT_239483 [Galerina marginata CBS 339.88]|uniref:DUF1766-domain-containing protein n=1 Tax=Galerina marginata (strain CBS 339.88) TaxID=685588 RepID=A0A067TE78_GALM3|nr:hypothetical protein GALMADRAFT_239483 [Galerina marginata CBS 339.88]
MSKSTTEKSKKLQNFLYKLADSFDLQKPDVPPKPPPKPPQPGNANAPSSSTSSGDITTAFNSLTISNAEKHDPVPSAAPFIGGFNPAVQGNFYGANHLTSPNPTDHSLSAPNLSMPLAIPTPYVTYPQSLTMQMALRPDQDIPPIGRVHSNPIPSSSTLHGYTAFPAPGPSVSSRPSNNAPLTIPSTPSKASKSEVSSTVSTPSQKSGQVQCSGVTKAGKRCNRMIKIKPSAATLALEDEEWSLPQFCHQHTKELLGPSGYYARKNGEWVKFEDWIPPYLQPDTQVSLRIEMEKTRSQSDVHGYIYTFEIREPQDTEIIKLKVGRAVNLVKRIDQWGKQCGSKEQILRGFFPGTVEPDEDGNTGSLMKGRVKAGDKGPWCHRLERLVHLELADLVSSSIYLDPAWPKIDASDKSNAAENNLVSSKDPNSSKNIATTCPDCGSVHKEIFEFRRWKRGKNKGKEWEVLVKPVVERWGKFVELYV